MNSNTEKQHRLDSLVYDGVGNVRSVTDVINGQSGATTSYDYDALDRLIAVVQGGPRVAAKRVEFAYNPLGQFDTITRYASSGADPTRLVARSGRRPYAARGPLGLPV